MVEGLTSILILAFLTLIAGIILKSWWIIIPQIILISIAVFLLVRVRVKIAKAEKEKLRSHIDELEKKIESLVKKTE
jgi:c-di-AMP phosphodiesterase-like protein